MHNPWWGNKPQKDTQYPKCADNKQVIESSEEGLYDRKGIRNSTWITHEQWGEEMGTDTKILICESIKAMETPSKRLYIQCSRCLHTINFIALKIYFYIIHSFFIYFYLKNFYYIYSSYIGLFYTQTFKNYFKWFSNFHLYICVCVHAGVCHLWGQKDRVRSPVVGNTPSGAGNQTQPFWETIKCS